MLSTTALPVSAPQLPPLGRALTAAPSNGQCRTGSPHTNTDLFTRSEAAVWGRCTGRHTCADQQLKPITTIHVYTANGSQASSNHQHTLQPMSRKNKQAQAPQHSTAKGSHAAAITLAHDHRSAPPRRHRSHASRDATPSAVSVCHISTEAGGLQGCGAGRAADMPAHHRTHSYTCTCTRANASYVAPRLLECSSAPLTW